MPATWEELAGPEACLLGHRKAPPPLKAQDPLRKIFLEDYFWIIGLSILRMFQSHLFRNINPETQVTKFYISVFIVVRFFSIVRTTFSSWLKSPIWMSGLKHWKYVVIGMNAMAPVVQVGSHLSGDSMTRTISEPLRKGGSEHWESAWGPRSSHFQRI